MSGRVTKVKRTVDIEAKSGFLLTPLSASDQFLQFSGAGGVSSASLLPTYDTMIQGGVGVDRNFGVGFLNCDTSLRPLLKFPLGSYNPNKILSATLRIKQRNSASNVAGTINVYPLKAANANWIEGTQNGTTALAGEPSWNNRQHPSTPWAGSVGAAGAGTDYVNDILGTFTIDTANLASEPYFSAALDITKLRSALQAEGNAGYILRNGTGAFYASSKESAGKEPYLDLTLDPSIDIPLDANRVRLRALGLVATQPVYMMGIQSALQNGPKISTDDQVETFSLNGARAFTLFVPAGERVLYQYLGQTYVAG